MARQRESMNGISDKYTPVKTQEQETQTTIQLKSENGISSKIYRIKNIARGSSNNEWNKLQIYTSKNTAIGNSNNDALLTRQKFKSVNGINSNYTPEEGVSQLPTKIWKLSKQSHFPLHLGANLRKSLIMHDIAECLPILHSCAL